MLPEKRKAASSYIIKLEMGFKISYTNIDSEKSFLIENNQALLYALI